MVLAVADLAALLARLAFENLATGLNISSGRLVTFCCDCLDPPKS
jgi:hypothetical protein